MLRFIEEFQKYVVITGFKNVKINNVDRFLKRIDEERPLSVKIQVFDAKFVATWQHLYFAVLNALTAFKNRKNISRDLAMETLLYASAQRQIRKATETLGIKSDTTRIAVLIIGEKPKIVETTLPKISRLADSKEDESVLEMTNKKKVQIQKTFGISDEELGTIMKDEKLEDALINLVIERIALLSTER